MKHSVLCVCLVFVVNFSIGRSSGRLYGTGLGHKNGHPYEVEEIFVVEREPIVKSHIGRDDPTEGDNEDQPEKVSYRGFQLWKTIVDNQEKVKILVQLRDAHDISMWGGNVTSVDILVKPGSIGKVSTLLTSENIKYGIQIRDLQTAIDEENPPITEEHDNRKGHRLTWQAYHRSTDIMGYLDYLAETYPNLCTVSTIGYSVQRQPIKLLKISNGRRGNKAIWLDGGIHAREWISPASATFIIEQITSNYEYEPEYIQNIDWYIAPLLNPDGYEYSHNVDRLWRKNRARSGRCAGTDLNRNFGYRWGGPGSSQNQCAETYGGTGPFSEPETAAIQKLITGTKANWKAYISLHSYGQYILYPWGYNRVVPPDHRDLDQVGRQAADAILALTGNKYKVGPAGNTLYPASGGSDDWAKGSIQMKYSYTIELRDTGRHGFLLPGYLILDAAREALAAVRVIAKAAYAA